MALLDTLGKYRNTGLLLARLGIGAMFILHGYPKLLGGSEKWELIGGSMRHLGITFAPTVWGLMAGVTETFGGFLLILGLAFRPVCLLLLFTMIVASMAQIKTGNELMSAAEAIENGFFFLGLIFIGPGKYSVDKK